MSSPTVAYQTTTVWWSDWSWAGWNCVNGGIGALMLIFVLVGVACCINAALMPDPYGYYYYRPVSQENTLPYRIDAPNGRPLQHV